MSITTEQDPLLQELQGVPGLKPSQPDGPVPSDTTGVGHDPLNIAPKVAPSPVARMDAKYSIKAGGQGYRVVVRGEYYRSSKDEGRRAERGDYELEFCLPSLDGALSLILRNLLMPALVKKYPDAIKYRTHDIVSATPLSPETPESTNLQFMSREKLEAFSRENSIPVVLADFGREEAGTAALRASLIDFTLNPKGFEEREAKKKVERAELAVLAKLNPDLDLGV